MAKIDSQKWENYRDPQNRKDFFLVVTDGKVHFIKKYCETVLVVVLLGFCGDI